MVVWYVSEMIGKSVYKVIILRCWCLRLCSDGGFFNRFWSQQWAMIWLGTWLVAREHCGLLHKMVVWWDTHNQLRSLCVVWWGKVIYVETDRDIKVFWKMWLYIQCCCELLCDKVVLLTDEIDNVSCCFHSIVGLCEGWYYEFVTFWKYTWGHDMCVY